VFKVNVKAIRFQRWLSDKLGRSHAAVALVLLQKPKAEASMAWVKDVRLKIEFLVYRKKLRRVHLKAFDKFYNVGL